MLFEHPREHAYFSVVASDGLLDAEEPLLDIDWLFWDVRLVLLVFFLLVRVSFGVKFVKQ